MNFLLFFLFLLPFSLAYIMPGLFSSLITFFLPRELIGIYVKFFLIFAVWWYIQILQIPSPNNFNDRFGELELQDEIFWTNMAIALFIVVLKLYCTESYDRRHSNILRDIDYCIFAIYGLFGAYLLNLFYGDMFAGYQPAYQAYLLAIGMLLIFGAFAAVITSIKRNDELKTLKRSFQFFSYSLCGAMAALLIFSLSNPILAVIETNKIVKVDFDREPEYCIQMLTANRTKRYQSITTLLDLSPLTMRSKAELSSPFGWGKPYFHSLLVVKKQYPNHIYTHFYNWSYKQRKWTYLESGFAERASIDRPEIVCNPQNNYLQQIPWIFPK